MGWRADAAYEKADREDYDAWRKSLSWREWLRWQVDRYWAFAFGVVAATVACWPCLDNTPTDRLNFVSHEICERAPKLESEAGVDCAKGRKE